MEKNQFSQQFLNLPLDEAKTLYRKLALKYHPDRQCGSVELMKLINVAFEEYLSNLETFANKNKETETELNLKEILKSLFEFENLTIDLVGDWVWVYGEDTRKAKEILKGLNFRWAKKKKKWYKVGTPVKRGGASYKKIVKKYGQKTLKNTGEKKWKKCLT